MPNNKKNEKIRPQMLLFIVRTSYTLRIQGYKERLVLNSSINFSFQSKKQ